MEAFDACVHQHRRYNPLKGEWVLVSPHRMKRPWKGQVEKDDETDLDDSMNPLCPGGQRPNGVINPMYKETFIFENDFPAILKMDFIEQPYKDQEELLKCEPATGRCYVMCFHSKSNVTLATMENIEVVGVIKKWIEICKSLQDKYTWVQIFENKGAIMGCSNPHPHCQIWASSFLPSDPERKDIMQKKYFDIHHRPLLVDYVELELKKKERLVIESEFWVCLVPYWAVWPYETYVIPKRHIQRLQDLTADESNDLADISKKLLCKYDNIFKTSFPYSMGWLGAPTGKYLKDDCSHWQLHAIYLPPLLRSATIKKFMVGYEMLAEPQRDLTAEQAAKTLREISDTHFKEQQ